MKFYSQLRLESTYYRAQWHKRNKDSSAKATTTSTAQEGVYIPYFKLFFYRYLAIRFFDMWKDAKDTFKPYKSDVARDVFYPFYGVGNLLQAVTSFIGIILVPFHALTIPFKKNKTDFTGQLLAQLLLNLANLVVSILRGVTQIAATPFVWLRIILRGAITAVKGVPHIEDSKGLRQLAYQTIDEQNPEQDRVCIAYAMYQKFLKKKVSFVASDIKIKDATPLFDKGQNKPEEGKPLPDQFAIIVKNNGEGKEALPTCISEEEFNRYRGFFQAKFKARDEELATPRVAHTA